MVEEAWGQDEQWGLYLWLAMVLGARRGELVALRWQHVDFDTGFISLRRNYVRAGGEGYDKDTKGHQMPAGGRNAITAVATSVAAASATPEKHVSKITSS